MLPRDDRIRQAGIFSIFKRMKAIFMCGSFSSGRCLLAFPRGRARVRAVMTLSAVLKLLGARGRAGHSFSFFALQLEFVTEIHVFLKYYYLFYGDINLL